MFCVVCASPIQQSDPFQIWTLPIVCPKCSVAIDTIKWLANRCALFEITSPLIVSLVLSCFHCLSSFPISSNCSIIHMIDEERGQSKSSKWTTKTVLAFYFFSLSPLSILLYSCRRDNPPFTHCILEPRGRDIAPSIWCHSPVRSAQTTTNQIQFYNYIILHFTVLVFLTIHLLILYIFNYSLKYGFLPSSSSSSSLHTIKLLLCWLSCNLKIFLWTYISRVELMLRFWYINIDCVSCVVI